MLYPPTKEKENVWGHSARIRRRSDSSSPPLHMHWSVHAWPRRRLVLGDRLGTSQKLINTPLGIYSSPRSRLSKKTRHRWALALCQKGDVLGDGELSYWHREFVTQSHHRPRAARTGAFDARTKQSYRFVRAGYAKISPTIHHTNLSTPIRGIKRLCVRLNTYILLPGIQCSRRKIVNFRGAVRLRSPLYSKREGTVVLPLVEFPPNFPVAMQLNRHYIDF
jgi:hypothetical protein